MQTGWTHVVLNYIGPDDGIEMYMDGVEVATAADSFPSQSGSPGNGKIVVGRGKTDVDDLYYSVEVDELIYFNSLLKIEQIEMLAEKV